MNVGLQRFHRYLAKEEYAERFFDTGELMVGSVARYKAMENDRTDLIRGDRDEGFAKSVVDGLFDEIDESTSPIVRAIVGWSPRSIVKGNLISGGRVDMSSGDLQVLCLSGSMSFRLAMHFGSPVCISIENRDEVKAVLSSACGEGFTYRGFRSISYANSRTRDYRHPDAMRWGGTVKTQRVLPDGFQIEREREIRAIWTPNPGTPVLPFRIAKVPELRQFARLFRFTLGRC